MISVGIEGCEKMTQILGTQHSALAIWMKKKENLSSRYQVIRFEHEYQFRWLANLGSVNVLPQIII